MDVVLTRCAGLDVHKKRSTACRRIPAPPGQEAEGIAALRMFGTMTRALLVLADWLTEARLTPVALASTGEYWQPVFHLLEGLGTVLLVHATDVKHGPGRKTDKAEARWRAKLMRLGLLQASCIPPQGQRDVRDLTRYRTKWVQERVREVHRVQGVLARTTITLASVIADRRGGSGRAMLEALMAGRADPATLADWAKRRMRSKMPLIEQALTGIVHAHHRQLLAMQRAHMDFLDEPIAALPQALAASLKALSVAASPSDTRTPLTTTSPTVPPGVSPPLTLTRASELLATIPGVEQRGAEGIVAESGMARTRCETAPRFAAWAGVAPGHDARAGQQRSGNTRKGQRPLRAILSQLAHAAVWTSPVKVSLH